MKLRVAVCDDQPEVLESMKTILKETGLVSTVACYDNIRELREELQERLEERAPSVFFSSELCAHYFTYMSRQNGAHFVLFDDAGSIRKKLQTARSMGITSAVLAYPQVDDLLEEILK